MELHHGFANKAAGRPHQQQERLIDSLTTPRVADAAVEVRMDELKPAGRLPQTGADHQIVVAPGGWRHSRISSEQGVPGTRSRVSSMG